MRGWPQSGVALQQLVFVNNSSSVAYGSLETAPLMNRNQPADVPLNVFTELGADGAFFPPLTRVYHGVMRADEL